MTDETFTHRAAGTMSQPTRLVISPHRDKHAALNDPRRFIASDTWVEIGQ